MDVPHHFDPLTAPLEGINLIEASAGTGKTYTLEILFIRLILEKERFVNQILVVTFTEAATEELRDRIRRRLYEVSVVFQQGFSEEPKFNEYFKNYPKKGKGKELLTNALRGFDEAAIFTIHGFCRRMLRDNAFESGLLFDTELVKDQSQLLQEVVEDFWRQHFYSASPLFINYVSDQMTPSTLLNIIGQGRYVGQPFLKIIPESHPLEATLVEQVFSQWFNKAKTLWGAEKDVIERMLLQDKWLNRTSYKPSSIPKWCHELSDYFSSLSASMSFPKDFKKLTTSHLTAAVKKGGTPPQHPFFEVNEKFFKASEQLLELYRQKLLSLEITLFKVAEQTLIARKYQQNIHSFDDLLINLFHALKNDKNQLAQRIRKQYPVALIDEFQDTDQVQYEIFRMIYHYPEKENILFLIGDSKQAIYSFRGADIYTYVKANKDATYRYTLPYNWRSEPGLIQAINTLFTQIQQPFIPTGIPISYPQISFYPVQAAQSQSRLVLKNQDHSPLELWFVPAQEAEKPLTKEWAKKHIPIAVANEIKRLLDLGQRNQAIIHEKDQVKPVEASDITVLVRTHTQAHLIQKELLRAGVPSVLYSRRSIFDSHEVIEIERVLKAIAEPHRENAVRVALTTDMLGVSALQLYHLLENDSAWQEWLRHFHHYQFLWQTLGFIYMFRVLLTEQKVAQRLLSYPDGERRLTNVLHLAEILQQTSIEKKLGIQGLCTWLSQQRLQQEIHDEGDEERQLRLESDEKRVKIVTIHKSKGLEYPIVFCPFVWEGRSNRQQSKNNPFTFHDDQQILTLDLGSEQREENLKRTRLEEQAENLRLFYVAITRAKYRCYLIWGVFKEVDTSPLAHLLHGNLENIEENLLRQKLQELVKNSEKTIQEKPLPLETVEYQRPSIETTTLHARPFTGTIVQDWKISSFTALSSHVFGEKIERPDYDETAFHRVETIPTSKRTIFNFPGGARVGVLIHQLFEQIDFTAPLTEADPLIEKVLNRYGYDLAWQPVLSKLIADVITTPLEPKSPKFNLSQVSREMRLNELEFYYPMKTVTPQDLKTVFEKFNCTVKITSFSTLQGFMRGFIDLIFQYENKFYLVDYKSNFLGTQEAYHRSQLDRVMQQENYLLQYHIYTVALHRYLSLRLPNNYRYEHHFGGVYYLFVRGMRPQWGANFGIYRDIPKFELIDELSKYFGESH